jgi:hypothetical protein
MPKVKIIEVYGVEPDAYADSYDDAYSGQKSGWEEISQEDFQLLAEYVYKHNVKARNENHAEPIYMLLAERHETVQIPLIIKDVMTQLKREEAEEAAKREKEKQIQAKRKETLAAKKAEKEKKLLEELEAKYRSNAGPVKG